MKKLFLNIKLYISYLYDQYLVTRAMMLETMLDSMPNHPFWQHYWNKA